MCTFFLEMFMDYKYMNMALLQANKAFVENEVPVGAVIVKNGVVIAVAHNRKATTNNVYGHAEMIAIQKSAKKLGNWRLNDCIMYVTLEPCPMCASAIQQSRIKKVYIGATSNIKSNKNIITSIFQSDDLYHKVDFEYVNFSGCSNVLSNFFAQKRG